MERCGKHALVKFHAILCLYGAVISVGDQRCPHTHTHRTKTLAEQLHSKSSADGWRRSVEKRQWKVLLFYLFLLIFVRWKKFSKIFFDYFCRKSRESCRRSTNTSTGCWPRFASARPAALSYSTADLGSVIDWSINWSVSLSIRPTICLFISRLFIY